MVPAFGFSAVDFVSAIGLTIKISKALRETGGASAECRMVLQDLQNLQQVLQLLQDLRPADGNLSRVNAIRGLAITCLIPLKEFAQKIDRSYRSMASVLSSDHILRRSGKKAHWTVFAAEEVAKFRSVVAAKVASIGLLLGIFNNESLSRIEAQNRECKNSLLAKAAEHRDSLERNLSKSIVSHHHALSNQISEAGKGLEADVLRIEAQAQSQHNILLKEADQHTRKLERLSRQIGQVQKDTYSSTRDIMGLCLGTTAGTERMFRSAQQRSQRIEDEMTSIRKQQNDIGSRMLDQFQSVFFHLRLVGMAGASVLGCLIPFSEKVLGYLRENMKANFEIYALLLKVQSSMPKQLDNGDQIHFEDVLGRTKTLPYEYFRHWEVFESMLRCDFRGFPGEAKVLQGQYLLLDSTSQKEQIDRDAWQQRVFPGTRVKMSVLMQNLGATSGFCPRPSCNGRVDGLKGLTVHHCPACGLEYVPQRSFHTEGHGLDVVWPRATFASNRKVSRMPLSKEVIHNDELSIAERRKQRESKTREKAEREFQEITVFRMVHILQSPGGMQRKHVPEEVEDILSDISAEVYQERTILFEHIYRKVYRLLLRKTHAQTLYEKVASMIPTYIEDLVDYPLQKAIEKAIDCENPFDAATLAKISSVWQNFSRSMNPMVDCLTCLVRISLAGAAFSPRLISMRRIEQFVTVSDSLRYQTYGMKHFGTF